jgi:hypothetical protein
MNGKSLLRHGRALVLGALLLVPVHAGAITIGKAVPEISGKSWINSAPLTIEELRGRVVMVEFWTYG